MAIASLPLDVVGNTAQLRRQIEQIQKTPLILDVRAGGRGAAPLGRISGDISEIDKSLAAANARVIAFGASVGAIYALQRAVEGLFQSFVNTEKKLADINAVLNLDGGGLAAFGDSLFDVAANTAQSFDVVATAATELARQGLGVDETLRRTNDALILTRLSGLDAAASVEALTAAINSFSTQALNSTEIVNKLANVDAAFAVSSADLAEALSRVGSSASDAGVSFDELIALVTTAQQVTARGGSVIGNSLKTIFTRLNRQETLDLLGGLGIETTDAEGKLKNQVQLLKELAIVYNDLNQVQRGEVAEKVGGVFQINILRAALSDLGKEYSIYDRALQTSVSSTDEAIQRNAQLNQTLAALGAQTLANVQKSASKIGEGLFGPAANNVLNAINYLSKAADQIDSNGIGAKVGKGIVDGIGRFLGGPGLAILGAVLTKLGLSFAKYLGEASKSVLGTNQAAKNQAAIQQAVGGFLAKNSTLYQSILRGQTSSTQAAQLFLKQIQAQTSELQRQVAVANAVAAAVSKAAAASRSAAATTAAVPIRTGGRGKVKAMGHVPNFSAAATDAYLAKKKGGYEPGSPNQTRIGGQVINWNGAESLVQYPGAKTEAIVPPENSKAGKVYRKDFAKASGGMDPYDSAKAMGFVPNFAFTIGGKQYRTNAAVAQNIRSGNITQSQAAAAGYKPSRNSPAGKAAASKQSQRKPDITVGGPRYAYLYASGGDKGLVASTAFLPDNRKVNFSFSKAGIKKPFNFKDEINQNVTPGFNKVAQKIYPNTLGGPGYMMQYFDKSGTNQTLGRLFEAAVLRAVRPKADVSGTSGGSSFDIPSLASGDRRAFAEIFSGAPTYRNADFKYSPPGGTAADGNVKSFVAKLLGAKGVPATKKDIFTTPRSTQSSGKKAALGFIPNFVAQMKKDAIRKESSAGVPKGKMYFSQESALAGANPLSLGLFNTIDEPNQKSRDMAMSNQGFAARGYVPNFAAEDDGGGIGSGLGASAISAAILASLFVGQRGEGSELGKAIDDEVQVRKDAIKQQRMAEAEKQIIDREEQKRKYRTVQNERTGETQYVSKKTGRYVDPTLGQRELQRVDRNIQNERDNVVKAIDKQTQGLKPTAMDRVKGAVRTPSVGLGAAIAAPILASVVADMIPKTSQAGRTASSTVTGIGDVVSMAGTGALIGSAGGPKGATVGAIIGAGVGLWQAFSGTVKEASTDMPELAAAAEAATTDFQKFQDSTTTASTALQKYQDIVDAGGSELERQKALGEYQQALLNIDPKDMAELEQLMSMGDSFNQAAEKIARLKIPDIGRTQATSDLAEILPKIKEAIENQQVPTGDTEKALRDLLGKGLFAGQSPKEILGNAGFALDPNLLDRAFDPRLIEGTLKKLIPGSDKSSQDLREKLRQALQDENLGGYVQQVIKEAVGDKAKQALIVKNTEKTAEAVVDLNKSMYGGAAGLVANQPKLQPSADQQTIESLLDWTPTTTAFDPKIGGYRPFESPVNSGKPVQEARQAIIDAENAKAYGEAATPDQISKVFQGVLQKQIIALEQVGGDIDQAAVIAAGRVRQMFDLDNQAVGNMPSMGDLLHGWLARALEKAKVEPQNAQLQENAREAQEAYDNFIKNSLPKGDSSATEKMLAKMREDSVKLAEMETQARREILEATIKGLGKAPADYEYINENIEAISDALQEARDKSNSFFTGYEEKIDLNSKIAELEAQLESEIQKILLLGETSESASQSIRNMSDCAEAVCDKAGVKSPIAEPLIANAAANGTPSVIAPAPASTPFPQPSATPAPVVAAERNPFAESAGPSVVTKITSVEQKLEDSKRILADLLNANQGSQTHLGELIAPVQSIVDNASAMSEKMDLTLKPSQISQMFKTSSAAQESSISRLGTSISNDVLRVDTGLSAALKLMAGISELNDIKTESQSIDGHAENLDENVKLGNTARLDILEGVQELTDILPILKQISESKILKDGCLNVCKQDIATEPLSGKTKEDLIEGFRKRVSNGLAQGKYGAPIGKSALTPQQGEQAIGMWDGSKPKPMAKQLSGGISPLDFSDVQSYLSALANKGGGSMTKGAPETGMEVLDFNTGVRSFWEAGGKNPSLGPNAYDSQTRTKEQQIEAGKATVNANGPVTVSGENNNFPQQDFRSDGDSLQNVKQAITKAFQDAVLDRMQAQNGGGFRLDRDDAFGGGWAGQLPPDIKQKIAEWETKREELARPPNMMPWQEAMNEVMNQMLTGGVPDQFFQGGEMTDAGNEVIKKLLDFVLPVNPLYPGEEPSLAPLENTKPLPLMPGETGYQTPLEPSDPFVDYVPPNALPAPTPAPVPTPTTGAQPGPSPALTPEGTSSCLTNDSVRNLCSGSVNSAMGSPVGAAGGGANSQAVGAANINAQQANVSSPSVSTGGGVGAGTGNQSSSGLPQAAESAATSLSSVSQAATSTASAFGSLNTAIPYTSEAFGALSSVLPNVTAGFGQLSSQVPSVSSEFGVLEGSIDRFSSRVSEINFEAFNQGIRSIGDSASSLKQVLGTPIQIDIGGRIDAPQITTTVNVDTSAVASAVESVGNQIMNSVNAWKRNVESRLQAMNSKIANVSQSANNARR